MFSFLSLGSGEPVAFVLRVILLGMANIDIHGGGFHSHVFLVTSYSCLVWLFFSLVFQHLFFLLCGFFFHLSTLLECFPALVIPSQIASCSPITSDMACPNDLGASAPAQNHGDDRESLFINRDDRESPGEIALAFWCFCDYHFRWRFRIVARCCTPHPVSAQAVPA